MNQAISVLSKMYFFKLYAVGIIESMVKGEWFLTEIGQNSFLKYEASLKCHRILCIKNVIFNS
jgi:hypothetical protein